MRSERKANQRRVKRLAVWAFLLGSGLSAAVGSLSGCGSDAELEPALEVDAAVETASPGPDSEAGPVVDGGVDAACADASADADIDCTGRCGPVKDACTGKVKACGGCEAVGGEPRVCDLASNTCIKPKVTCTDFGAECGTVKDSCGNYLDCPDTNPKGCSGGKECDPDTHKCRDCQNVTCKDLGIECGFAWLGCGEDTPANYTDCGGCSADDGGAPRVCNGVLHVCEPACTPQSAAELCAAAKAKKGVQCGIITNGCGGTVNCDSVPGFGCVDGESCGVRGIANRCDKKQLPDECKALGRNCGEITSACTGLTVKCGECAPGQVCNSNGVCGTPCAAKTCADFAAFECGTFEDGCGSTVTCGSCPSGICDDSSKTCCAANTCGATYAGQCGSSLPNGCGQNNLTCACTGGVCTTTGGDSPPPPASTAGACCTPITASTYTNAGQCGTNLPNHCGQNTINATCGDGKECVNNANGSPGPAPPAGVVGSCCTRSDSCSSMATGTCGSIQNSCRTSPATYSCDKCLTPDRCVTGTCCVPAPACSGTGEGAECNITKTPVDPGCGSNRTCTCSGGRTCWCTDHACTGADGVGSCKSALTCGSPGYNGKCGTSLPNGVGGTINCGCGTGRACSTSTPGVTGTCGCDNPTGVPYTCSNVPRPGGDACGTFSNGCGSTITCGCTTGLVCNTTPNPNECCAPAVCPTPGVGSACGTLNNGCTTVSCGCPSGAGNENFTCSGGVCACVKDTCRGRTGFPPDRCGGTLDCGG